MFVLDVGAGDDVVTPLALSKRDELLRSSWPFRQNERTTPCRIFFELKPTLSSLWGRSLSKRLSSWSHAGISTSGMLSSVATVVVDPVAGSIRFRLITNVQMPDSHPVGGIYR